VIVPSVIDRLVRNETATNVGIAATAMITMTTPC
jgi:hypothetical protein